MVSDDHTMQPQAHAADAGQRGRGGSGADDAEAAHVARRLMLLHAMLPEAAFEGWNAHTLARAAKNAGLPEGGEALACPGGVVELIDAWGRACDDAVIARLAATDLAALKVRERVTLGVRTRIEAIGEENREAARRAAARLSLPDGAGRANAILWRAADTIWRAIGDTSTDGNFYSKRVILSGVIANTLVVWLANDEPEVAWRTLDRRIANVMTFEKTKAQVQRMVATAPDLMGVLTRLRYGGRR